MMLPVLACAAVVTSGAVAVEPFYIKFVDSFRWSSPASYSGGPLLLSQPLFQHPLGYSFGGPHPDAIDLLPELAFDSYLALNDRPSDGGDPAVEGDGYFADPAGLLTLGSPYAVPGEVGAFWIFDPALTEPGRPSVPAAVFDGAEAVFIGRYSFRTTDGSAPTGSVDIGAHGLVVDIVDSATRSAGQYTSNSLLIKFNSLGETQMQGVDGANLQTYSAAQLYSIRLHTFEAVVGSSRFLVHDMYVVTAAKGIPSPGACAVLGAAALTAIRRRRPVAA